MGQFVFDVDDSQQPLLAGSLWPSAYLSGIEGVPWHTLVKLDGPRLTVCRDIDESGKLFLPLALPGNGIASLGTCSLLPRQKPYPLMLELARGSLANVRTQADMWQRAGLQLDAGFHELLDEATGRFLDASGHPLGLRQSEDAVNSLVLLEDASRSLCDQYASQAIAFHKQRETRLGTLVGAVLPAAGVPTHAAEYLAAFNTAAVRMNWGDIETDAGRLDFDATEATVHWATSSGLRVLGGPLLDFHDKQLPHWVYLLDGQFHQFLDAINHFAEQAVKRFRGRVHIWNPVSGLNTPGPIRLSEEEVMQVATTLVQTIRRQDPQTPVIFSFDQPHGEYLAHHRDGISPLHFADTLARCGLGLAGLGLEMRIGYTALGMSPRNALAIGQLLDRWATLGMPLLLQLAIPANRSPDPLARRPGEVIGCSDGLPDDGRQMKMASAILRCALAKPYVHAILWEGWDDTAPHPLPHAGLWEAGGGRPLLQYFKRLRNELLN